MELLETQISKCADFPLEVGQTGVPVMEARHRIALRRPRRLCARKSTRWLLGFPTVEKIGRPPPTLICEHGSSFSEVGKTGSPVTAPRSDASADCVRARERDADAFRDGRENRSPPASHTAYATR